MPDPLPLAYADPDVDRHRPGRQVDWPVAVLTGGQAGLAMLILLTLAVLIGYKGNTSGPLLSGILFYMAYAVASVAAFVGSLWVARRRLLYQTYQILVPVGIVLLTTFAVATARRVYPETYWQVGLAVLIFNPAWLLLAVRTLRRGMTGWTVRRP